MDLHTLAERYNQTRHFWAREIALTLSGRIHTRMRQILHIIADSSSPITVRRLSHDLKKQRRGEAILKELSDAYLVRRHAVSNTRGGRIYNYFITELGNLVLSYLPSADLSIADHENGNADLSIADHENGNADLSIADHENGNADHRKQTYWHKNRDKGMCGSCGKVPPMSPNRAMCAECHSKTERSNKKYRERSKLGTSRHALAPSSPAAEDAP